MRNEKHGNVVAGCVLAVVLAAGLVACGAPATGSGADDAYASTETASATAPSAPMLADYDATVYTQGGDAMSLSEIANGKPLVVNFWATWCPYCLQEMGDYQRLYHMYGDRVSFAFVDCDYGRGETQEAALAWLDENGFSDLPSYFDTDADASKTFGASSLPTTVVVTGEGEILANNAGMIEFGRMDATLSSLVSEQGE